MKKILNNKKGWAAKDFLVASLIFSSCLAIFVVMIASIANDYENTEIINEDFSEKFDKFSEEQSRIKEMWNASTSEGGLSLIGTADLLFSSTFNVINLIFISVIGTGEQLSDFGEFFGIPSEISAIFMVLIFTILTVTIIFIVINSVRAGSKL